MKSHLKRIAAPRTWKIDRKKNVFVIKPKPSGNTLDNTLSVTFLIRDLLSFAKTKAEVKFILLNNSVLINGKQIKDTKASIGVFDVISFTDIDKYFRVIINKLGYVDFVEIKKDESNIIFGKLVGKVDLGFNKKKEHMFQINLHNGFNFLIKASEQSKYLISSSIVYDLDKKKVLENIPIEEKKNAFVFSGKSRGLFGEIVKIYPKNLLIKFDEFEKELPKKIILVYDSKSKVTLFKK